MHTGVVFVGGGGVIIGSVISSEELPPPPPHPDKNTRDRKNIQLVNLFSDSPIYIKFFHETPNS